MDWLRWRQKLAVLVSEAVFLARQKVETICYVNAKMPLGLVRRAAKVAVVLAALCPIAYSQLVFGDPNHDIDLRDDAWKQKNPRDSDSGEDSSQSEEGDVRAITAIRLGNPNCEERITIVVSPSCLHCGKFLLETLPQFLADNENIGVDIAFLPASAKDVFIMKLIQNEAKDEDKYYAIYISLIRAAIDGLAKIKPTDEEKEKFKGSNSDPMMLQYQVLTSKLGFSDEKIIDAIPNMDEPFEDSIIAHYKKLSAKMTEVLKTKDIDLPVFMYKNEHYKKLEDIPTRAVDPDTPSEKKESPYAQAQLEEDETFAKIHEESQTADSVDHRQQ
jgi:hypothetical protein